MAGWYRRADVYLSTSHHEGSNFSLIEALGFGCLPVVTSIPSHLAIVKELASTFAVGDAAAAGALIAAPPSEIPRGNRRVTRGDGSHGAQLRINSPRSTSEPGGRKPNGAGMSSDSSATLRLDMTGILLAHSYFLRLDPKQWEKMRPYPPLGTLYAAEVLRNAGHDVAVFDAMLAEGEHEFADALRHHRPRHVVLFEDNFNFLSKMCLARMREAALTMVTMAKEAGCHVAVAGADVTDHADVYLAGGADVCILGEGDHTVVEIVAAWQAAPQHPDYAGIDGISTLSRGATCATRSRSIERHPDVFGRPARDLIDIEAYRRAWVDSHGRFSLNMVSTRGCPYHCNWCAKPIWGQRYAMRTPADVAEELASVKVEIAPDHIWFADDIFGLRSDWLAQFAEARERARRGDSVHYAVQMRSHDPRRSSGAGRSRVPRGVVGCRER